MVALTFTNNFYQQKPEDKKMERRTFLKTTTLAAADPRSSRQPLEGSFSEEAPGWRQGSEQPPSFSNIEAVRALPEVVQARMLRGSMLVVTTNARVPGVGLDTGTEVTS